MARKKARVKLAKAVAKETRPDGDALKFCNIQRIPGVCGGDPCVRNTRIPVWVLYRAKQLGASDSKIRRMYPELKRHSLDDVWQYVSMHEVEIEKMIADNERW